MKGREEGEEKGGEGRGGEEGNERTMRTYILVFS